MHVQTFQPLFILVYFWTDYMPVSFWGGLQLKLGSILHAPCTYLKWLLVIRYFSRYCSLLGMQITAYVSSISLDRLKDETIDCYTFSAPRLTCPGRKYTVCLVYDLCTSAIHIVVAQGDCGLSLLLVSRNWNYWSKNNFLSVYTHYK